MKMLQYIVIISTCLSCVFFLAGCAKRLTSQTASVPSQLEKAKLELKDQTVLVEIADDPAEQEQGLSDRETLGSDGMLFVFAHAGTPAFWMKQMLFDLDFIWIKDGKVVEITQNVPKPMPNQSASSLTIYRPQQPVDQMLEVPAGFAQQHLIEVGDRAVLVGD